MMHEYNQTFTEEAKRWTDRVVLIQLLAVYLFTWIVYWIEFDRWMVVGSSGHWIYINQSGSVIQTLVSGTIVVLFTMILSIHPIIKRWVHD